MQAVASPLRQQAGVCVRFAQVSASRHLSRGTSAAGCLSFGTPETLHFINRWQCCYDRAQRSDTHAVLCALRWKSTNLIQDLILQMWNDMECSFSLSSYQVA